MTNGGRCSHTASGDSAVDEFHTVPAILDSGRPGGRLEGRYATGLQRTPTARAELQPKNPGHLAAPICAFIPPLL
jgi:hypothetical protein